VSAIPQNKLGQVVAEAVRRAPVHDIHTHLYDPAFGELLLWGLDELLTYHYLIAESFRYFDMPYEKFWAAPKTQQAEWIWGKLFLEHSPISEACRGVLTTLKLLGLDVKKRDLNSLRKWFAKQSAADYTTKCMELANVEKICMTNSPFDDLERPIWENGFLRDERFEAALRIDPVLVDWKATSKKLAGWGYKTGAALNAKTISELRRFLDDWTRKINARYLMVSLTPEFQFPSKGDECAELIEKAILPHCREHGLPFALMLGVRRQVNPQLRLAGDGVGRSDLSALQNLCAAYPENKFLVTVLSRENQHELCVLARKFRNLHIFGCWWFTNVPQVIDEMTRMRLELIGLSVTPQHSDARVLDQIIYKWDHSRELIGRVLTEKYEDLAKTGWVVTREEIERDVKGLFGGEFERFCGR
jgi:hypothetical protein